MGMGDKIGERCRFLGESGRTFGSCSAKYINLCSGSVRCSSAATLAYITTRAGADAPVADDLALGIQ